jgi:molecular chaperone GrpE
VDTNRGGIEAFEPSADGSEVASGPPEDERGDALDGADRTEGHGPGTPSPAIDDDQLRRALADLANLRARFTREVSRERDAARATTTAAWLPVLDDLERAMSHLAPDADEGVLDGLRAIVDKALHVLAQLGFERDDEIGVSFDPARHEAVAVVDHVASSHPGGTVVAVVEPGYRSGEVVVRPAKVVVARGDR